MLQIKQIKKLWHKNGWELYLNCFSSLKIIIVIKSLVFLLLFENTVHEKENIHLIITSLPFY